MTREEYLQRRRLYLEERELTVAPWLTANSRWEERASTYGLQVIKAGMLMNGGAFAIVTPVLVAMRSDLAAHHDVLMGVLKAFAAGLSFSWWAAIVGYIAMCVGQVLTSASAEAQNSQLLILYELCRDPEATARTKDQKERQAALNAIVYHGLVILAGVLCLASLGTFIWAVFQSMGMIAPAG